MALRRARRCLMCLTVVVTCIVVFTYNFATVTKTTITIALGSQPRGSTVQVTNSSILPSSPGPQPLGSTVQVTNSSTLPSSPGPQPLGSTVQVTNSSILPSSPGPQPRGSKVPATNSSILPSFPGPQPRGAKVPATTNNILLWPPGTQIPETASSILDTHEMRRKIKLFDVMITENEKRSFEILLKTFMKAVAPNVTYFLYSGSLLGSYRHHGMIPWDDDIDLVVRAKDVRRLATSLSKLAPLYILNQQGSSRWKFYHRTSNNIPGFSWKWPSIDISFYKENRTHIRDRDGRFPRFVFKRTDVFPLGKRPFMGLLLPTPRNTKGVLLQTYSISVCQNTPYDHRWERSIPASKQATLQCDLLKAIYPFVRREYSSNGTMEILERNNTRIGEFFLYDRD